jgi:outer membrane receptor protein involved in Fe transport
MQPSLAQSTAPAASSPPAASTAASPASSGTMATIVVSADQNILPTNVPVTSVYGLDLNVEDTPRSVTIITREQLSQIDIQDARDYSKLTSDAYTQSDFGTPAAPSIRGQPADVLVNGMRSGINADGNGPPVDFNNIESVNVVKGPPNASTGSSIFIGGYVDEITKRPFFDQFQGDAATTIGMYDQFRQNLDFGGPIVKNQLAYRISYSGNESGSYYNYVHDDSQYGYAALSWIPSDVYKLDFNASFGEVDYLENNGINRVTQQLIDSGQYMTGQSPNVNGKQALPGWSQPGYTIPGGPSTIYTPTGLSQISTSTNVRNPNDGAYAKTVNAQAIQTVNVNDDLKFVNNTFYQYLNWRTYNGQFYDQYTDGDYTVDNRFSALLNTDIPVIDATKSTDPKGISEPGLTFHNDLNTGVEFRFQQNTDYQSIATEPFNVYDLTQNPNTIYNEIPPSQYGLFGVAHIPGLPQKYVFDLNSDDDGKSELYQTGVFAQDVLQFTDQWSLIGGARADVYHVDAETPPGTPSSDYASASTTQVLPNLNISPTFKPVPWLTLYATVNRGQAPGNTGQSGSYSPFFLTPDGFHQWATMYEAGAKFDVLNNTLFFTATVYKEDRYDPASDGGSYRQRIEGTEFDLNYQPDKHFYASASYSYSYSHDISPGFQYNVIPENQAVTPGGVVPDTPSFLASGVDANAGTYKTPGFPDQVFSTLAVYRWDLGPGTMGVSADLQVTSPINVSWVGGVQIPWQTNTDFSVFYNWKQSEVKLSVYNATNQLRNWGAVNPIYGLDSIYAEEPIHLEGTLKIHF